MTTEWARGEFTISTDPKRIDLDVVHAHPELQGLRRWVLLTRDAHALYRKAGYTPLAKPDRYMERWAPNVYRS